MLGAVISPLSQHLKIKGVVGRSINFGAVKKLTKLFKTKIMKAMYGVTLNKNGEYRDVSNTLLGAKNFATRNGYKEVYKRMGYTTRLIAIKENNTWVTK